MQSSQLDTASPDQDGSHSHRARNTTKFLHPTESLTVYPRGKFATVEQLQLFVLKKKKVSAFTNKKHFICPVEKTFRTFFENRGGDMFLINQQWATIYLCYLKLQQNNLFKITQDSPTFLRHPVNPHRSILMLPLLARNLNLPGQKGQGVNPNSFDAYHRRYGCVVK